MIRHKRILSALMAAMLLGSSLSGNAVSAIGAENTGNESGADTEAGDSAEDMTDTEDVSDTEKEADTDGLDTGTQESGIENGSSSEDADDNSEDMPSGISSEEDDIEEHAGAEDAAPEEAGPDADEEEQADDTAGTAVFYLSGEGGILTIGGKDDGMFLEAETGKDSLTLKDAYGNTAVIGSGSASISDKDGGVFWEGGSIMLDGDGLFVVEEDGAYYRAADGSLEGAEEGDYQTAAYDDAAEIILPGEDGAALSYMVQAADGFKAESYEVPSDSHIEETENGFEGSAVFTEEGGIYSFTFTQAEKPAKKLMKAPARLGASRGTPVRKPARDVTYTYDADGGTFAEGGGTNQIVYHIPETYIVHSANLDDDGVPVEHDYPENTETVDTVTIDGADELYVTITYQGKNYDDWICIYDGSTTPSANNYQDSISGYLYGTTKETKEFVVSGDTVQIYLNSGSGSSSNGSYGYYATVRAEEVSADGTYKAPQRGSDTFVLWYVDTGDTRTYTSGEGFAEIYHPREEDTTLTAVYKRDFPRTDYNITFDANGGRFTDGTAQKAAVYSVDRSSSPNVGEDGQKERILPSSYYQDDTVRLDGAEKVMAKVKYEGGSTYDRLSLTYGSDYDTISGTAEQNKVYEITGNTVSFGFRTRVHDAPQDKLGYYAEVSGWTVSYGSDPVKDGSNFSSWNTEPDGSGEKIDPETYEFAGGMTLYAQYKSPKQGILFEDMTYVVVDEGADLSAYTAEHGRILTTDADIETKPALKFGGSQYGNQVKKIIIDADVQPDGRSGNPFLWFSSHPALTEIEGLDRVDTSKITNMYSAFASCTNLTELDLNSWDVSNVTMMNYMFSGCSNLKALNVSGWDTGKATGLAGVFSSCQSLERLNASAWDTSSATTMDSMFSGCKNLTSLAIKDWDTSNVTSINGMFTGCSGLKSLDLSKWNTSQMRGMSRPFEGCTGLQLLNISGWDLRNTSLDFTEFFASIGAHDHVISARNLKTNNSSIYLRGTGAKQIDLAGLNAPSLSSFSFNGNSLLETLNISGWNAPNITDMSGCFADLTNLETIIGIESFDTSKLKYASNAFQNTQKLRDLNLSGWNTSKLENMSGMFLGSGIENVIVSTWGTPVLKYADNAFKNCKNLKQLDLSGWNTSAMQTMSGFLKDSNKLDTLILGENFQFKGNESGLPYPDWEHIETGTKVADLWNNYDAENLSGIYKRTEILKELTTENIDEIEYDPAAKEISVYIVTDKYLSPAPIDIPSLYNRLRLDPELAAKEPRLKALLEDAVENGTYQDLDLKLNFKVRTYSDITYCSDAESIIWTFDVPKDNSKVIKMDIYKCGGTDRTYYGYIMNSQEEPDKFTLYDAGGNIKQVMVPEERHTYNDIGFGAPDDTVSTWKVNGLELTRRKAEQPVYPEYERYISYNRYMDNYEVIMPPGKYVLETTVPGAEGLRLTPVPPAGTDDTAAYTFTTPQTTDYANLTVFNMIKKGADVEYTETELTFGEFKKTDKRSGSGVEGAVYRFTSQMTGNVYYGKTDRSGKITHDRLYAAYNENTGELSDRYNPELYEDFLTEEIKAPDGYYINPETLIVCFVQDRSEVTYTYNNNIKYRDGISDTKEGTEGSTCTSCMNSDPDRCVCGDYGDCKCSNCGVPGDSTNLNYVPYGHKDQPWPSLYIYKRDILRNNLPGAVFQLIDKETDEVVDEWTTNNSYHIHKFNFEGSGQVGNFETGRIFIIREKTAPAGYEKAADVEVAVSYDSGILSRSITDEYASHDVVISKVDVGGNEIAGAQLKITGREKGKYADITPVTWISEAGRNKTVSLRPGSYVLHEEAVPESGAYLPASDIAFTVNIDGTITIGEEQADSVVMTDEYSTHTITIRKKDDKGNLLPGAVLKITGTDFAGNTVQEISFTSEAADKMLDLVPGDYTLTETEAPEGFEKAAPVEFRVAVSGALSVKQTDGTYAAAEAVEMTDEKTAYDLSVSKRVTGNLGNRTHVFSFRIELAGDYVGGSIAYTLNGESGTLALTDGAGTFQLGHGDKIIFTKIPEGTDYKVTETDGESRGYEVTYTNNEGTLTKNTDVAVRNNMGGIIPTSADQPWLLTILAAGTAGIIFMMLRRKKRTDC